jgi:hypothetical protein
LKTILAALSIATALTACTNTKASLRDAIAYRMTHPHHHHTQIAGAGFGLGSGSVELNAYGPGVGMDQFGRAVPHDPMLQVTPNAYGLGVGMDQFGRPVY